MLPSQRAGLLLLFVIGHVFLVLATMLFPSFADLQFVKVPLLQIAAMLLPLSTVASLFATQTTSLVFVSYAFVTALYEFTYGLWLLGASTERYAALNEGENIEALNILFVVVVGRILLLVGIVCSHGALCDAKPHERLALTAAKPQTQAAGYTGYLVASIVVCVLLQTQMVLLTVWADELQLFAPNLVLAFTIAAPFLAAIATLKGPVSIGAIVMLLGCFVAAESVYLLAMLRLNATLVAPSSPAVITFAAVSGAKMLATTALAYYLSKVAQTPFHERYSWWMSRLS